jgi:hypothetical protein
MPAQSGDGTQCSNRVGRPASTASPKRLVKTVRIASRISTDKTVRHFSIGKLFGIVSISGLANHIGPG